MNQPLVSVIVSTYNSEKYIEGKILDLLNQTIFDKLEIIIINSGSQQNEEAIIQKYLKKHDNIKYIRTEERETIYKAWNRGIKSSNGLFITNSNTDDRLRNDAFEILSDALIKNTQAAIVYGDQYITNVPNATFKECSKGKIIKFPDFNNFLQLARCLVGSQPMWRATLHFKEEFWYNESYEVCGDHEFQLKISEKYTLLHLPIVIGTFYKNFKRKENKEYQDLARTNKEGLEITYCYIERFIEQNSSDYLEKYLNKFKFWINMPISFYLARCKIIAMLFPSTFYYSLEFVYLISGMILVKKGKLKSADSIYKKYLRKKYSFRVEHQYQKLKILLNEK